MKKERLLQLAGIVREAELVGNVDHKPDKYDLGGAIQLKVHHNKDNTEVVLTGKGGSIFLTPEEWQDVVDSITGQGLRDLK